MGVVRPTMTRKPPTTKLIRAIKNLVSIERWKRNLANIPVLLGRVWNYERFWAFAAVTAMALTLIVLFYVYFAKESMEYSRYRRRRRAELKAAKERLEEKTGPKEKKGLIQMCLDSMFKKRVRRSKAATIRAEQKLKRQ